MRVVAALGRALLLSVIAKDIGFPHTPQVQAWKRYWLHLVVAVLAALGAASGLADASSVGGTLLWLLCLASALLNAVMFGVGWERDRGSHAAHGQPTR